MTGDFADWITTAEAAELTGYAAVHLRQLAQRGKIRAMKKGRDGLISREGVLAYAEKMRQWGTDKHDPWRTGMRRKKTRTDRRPLTGGIKWPSSLP